MLDSRTKHTLLRAIAAQYKLDWHGIHGAAHWARVRMNGLAIAHIHGADTTVIELFAFLHDSCRENDMADTEHGARACDFAARLRDDVFHISDHQFQLLTHALRDHSFGGIEHPNVTVMACWDADRLDLGRVGLMPDPLYLCTNAARSNGMIERAYARSVQYQNIDSINDRPDSPSSIRP